jgi:hypothetical protein
VIPDRRRLLDKIFKAIRDEFAANRQESERQKGGKNQLRNLEPS